MRHALLAICTAIAIAAAESWPDLPDPIGLGPRLVVIDQLRTDGVRIPAGISDAELIQLYHRTYAAPVAPPEPTPPDTAEPATTIPPPADASPATAGAPIPAPAATPHPLLYPREEATRNPSTDDTAATAPAAPPISFTQRWGWALRHIPAITVAVVVIAFMAYSVLRRSSLRSPPIPLRCANCGTAYTWIPRPWAGWHLEWIGALMICMGNAIATGALILWLATPAGSVLMYLGIRSRGGHCTCPACGSNQWLPADSPRAREMAGT